MIKGVAGVFTVSTEKGVFKCSARGVLKRGEEKIYVGDEVTLKQERGVYYIATVKPRKNLFTRPYVSNVDKLLIVVAAEPIPDYMLVDKLLVFCEGYQVDAEIIVNKSDLNGEVYDYCKRVYGDYYKVHALSAQTGEGVKELFDELTGNVCFAGQSAVGKTSLLNALCGLSLEVGGLSKIMRGRNTTRHVEIYTVRKDLFVYDTCGFSLLTLEGFDEYELPLYYPDFTRLNGCRFSTCTHTKEPDCSVKNALKEGKLDRARYDRYVAIFEELVEQNKK